LPEGWLTGQIIDEKAIRKGKEEGCSIARERPPGCLGKEKEKKKKKKKKKNKASPWRDRLLPLNSAVLRPGITLPREWNWEDAAIISHAGPGARSKQGKENGFEAQTKIRRDLQTKRTRGHDGGDNAAGWPGCPSVCFAF